MPIAKSISELACKIKGIAERTAPNSSDETVVLKLLQAYHKSLRPRCLFGRPSPFNFEKADPFSRISSSELGYYHAAMRTLYTLKPFNQRLLRYAPAGGQKQGKELEVFSSYSAAYAQLPFINFTPLCLFSQQLGSFYFYPTFILHYAPSAPLHQPTLLSLKQGQLDCDVIAAPKNYYSEARAFVQISLAGNALTLRFDFSPLAIEAFSFLQKHCIALHLPLSSKGVLFSSRNANSRIFQLVDFLHSGVFALPTLAENLEISLYDAALTLTEAYRIDWYAVEQSGAPRFSRLSYIDYLRSAIAHYSVDAEQLDNTSLFARLSSEYFTASLLYVDRLMQLANAALTLYPTRENRAEGVLLDLMRIAFSIDGYYPQRDLVSIPIMQALFITLLPNVPLSMRTFKLAYNKWPYAILITLSIFKRQDYLQQLYDQEFFAIKYARLASTKDAGDAAQALRRIAELMFSCCELKTQQKSYEFFRLKAQLAIGARAARAFNGYQPILFNLMQLSDPITSKFLVSTLNKLNAPKVAAAPRTPPLKLPAIIFIHAGDKGTLSFIFYEVALHCAQLSGSALRFAHCTVNLNSINLKTLEADLKKAASGVLVINVLPVVNTYTNENLSLAKKLIAQSIANDPPRVIFITFIGMQPEQISAAINAMNIGFFQSYVMFQHTATMRNFAYIFQRLAVFFQVSITREAIQAIVTRLAKSQRSHAMLFAHPVPVILSLFRRALLVYAQRQNDCLRNPLLDSTKAITAGDILNIKFNTPSL